MSTTTTTATLDARVRGYAEAVRLHLADLGPDAVDELTDGLEADLADSLADRSATFAEADDAGAVPDLATVFGPADQYAAELRSAAGLPPASTAPSAKAGLRQSLRGARARWLRLWEPLTTSPAWARFRALLTDLRPFGWVARGWLVAAFVDGWMRQGPWMLVPRHGVALFWFAIAVLVSVQWGRGRWQPFKWVKALATLATVVALLAVVPMSDNTIHSARWGWDQRGASWVQEDGVFVDGHPVTNIFPFDADGRPLENVQLFDEAGRPIQTRPADWASTRSRSTTGRGAGSRAPHQTTAGCGATCSRSRCSGRGSWAGTAPASPSRSQARSRRRLPGRSSSHRSASRCRRRRRLWLTTRLSLRRSRPRARSRLRTSLRQPRVRRPTRRPSRPSLRRTFPRRSRASSPRVDGVRGGPGHPRSGPPSRGQTTVREATPPYRGRLPAMACLARSVGVDFRHASD